MHPITALVLLVMASLSAAAIWYGRYYLPRVLDERFNNSLRAFGKAIELRFPCHEGLTARIVPLGKAVGTKLGLTRVQLRDLELAIRLRDIGLCAIPYRLVNEKPALEWTEADWDTYNRHQEVSGAMLESVKSLRHLAPIVRCHHTCYDGSDGPFFPQGDMIPIQARIIKVVAAYVWTERWQGEVLARAELIEGEGTSFDPGVVAAFLEVLTSSRVAEPAELAGLTR